MGKVTDPALLAALDGGDTKVTDPAILAQLEGPQAAQVGLPEAALRGAAQGATMGFGPNLEAGWKSLVGGGKYQDILSTLRGSEKNARAQHPIAYGAGEVAGGTLPAVAATALTGGAASPLLGRAALPVAVGQGALQGAGYSEGKDARSLARDTALGAGVGLAGYGVGQALGSASGGLARFARSRTTAATARATDQAAQEVADAIQTAQSAAGGEVQKGNRIVENMRRIVPDLSPEEQAVMQKLEARLVASNRAALPGQVAAIDARDAELAALKSGASGALAARKAELLKPQILKDVGSFAKAYGEPVAAAALAPAGMKTAAGVIFGRTRAGKALMSRLTRPGNEKAVFDALEAAAQSRPGDILRQLLSRGGTAAATQSLVEQ